MQSIRQEHEVLAWEAFQQARRRVPEIQPDGSTIYLQEWQQRHAPSVGARALAIVRNHLAPPSYIAAVEEALKLYLSDAQLAERRGFYSPRRSMEPGKGRRGNAWYG